MRGRWLGIRGRGPVPLRAEASWPPEPVRQIAEPAEPFVPRIGATRLATVQNGQTLSRTPCHERRVRIDGDVTGQNVVVRCPFCSRLWEVRFPPAATEPLFALWVT